MPHRLGKPRELDKVFSNENGSLRWSVDAPWRLLYDKLAGGA